MVMPHIDALVTRVLTSDAAVSTLALRREVFDYVAALTRGHLAVAPPVDLTPYVRKVALNAYKILDTDIDALQAAGFDVDEVFELTITAAVAAGATRLEIALAALGEVADAPVD
jgi:hypothetical protein